MNINLNLEYYKVFYYVAKTGSLTRAGEILSISQPAVSQIMKQLQMQLDTTLLIRSSRGVKLTPEGEVLYEYIKRGCEQFYMGEKALSRLKNLEAGEICIGASDMTLQYYLLPYLEQFHERYPQIKIMVTNAPTPETIGNLKDGKIDFGIVTTPFLEENDLKVRKVREIQDVFIAGRKYYQLKNHMTDFKELKEYPLILLEKNTSTRNYIDSVFLENKIALNPEFELANSEMIVQFALRNLGIGCVVEDFAREYIDMGRLFALRFNQMIQKRHMCVITQSKFPISSAATVLLNMLVN